MWRSSFEVWKRDLNFRVCIAGRDVDGAGNFSGNAGHGGLGIRQGAESGE
jgi:hypothetical protein